jgi:hypothetical protein
MRLFELDPGQKRQIKTPSLGSIKSPKYHFDQFWERLIEPNCSEILVEFAKTEKLLYRGTKSNNQHIYRGASWQSRSLKDSNPLITQYFDNLLAANGLQALRSNSVFTSSDKRQTSGYGNIYVFIPINGFKYTYTNQKDIILTQWRYLIPDDLYFHLNRKWLEAKNKRGFIMDYIGGSIIEDWLYNKDLYKVPTNKRLIQAIENLKALLPNDAEVQSLTVDKILLDRKSFAEKYEPTDTNLAFALKAGIEVYVKGQFYAFNANEYEQLIWNKVNAPI